MPGVVSALASIPAGVVDALRYSMGGAPKSNLAPQQWEGYANSSHQVQDPAHHYYR